MKKSLKKFTAVEQWQCLWYVQQHAKNISHKTVHSLLYGPLQPLIIHSFADLWGPFGLGKSLRPHLENLWEAFTSSYVEMKSFDVTLLNAWNIFEILGLFLKLGCSEICWIRYSNFHEDFSTS